MVAPLLAALALAPGHFSARVDNPYLPFKPGTTWRYRGAESGRRSLDVVTVTRRSTRIAGALCVVVRDRLYLAGRLAESTLDYYAQDRAGAVWYFGEATRELDAHGRTTSTEGTWRAGVRGARPGVVMPAHPRAGQTFAQERFPDHAEDMFRVLDRIRVTVRTASTATRCARESGRRSSPAWSTTSSTSAASAWWPSAAPAGRASTRS